MQIPEKVERYYPKEKRGKLLSTSLGVGGVVWVIFEFCKFLITPDGQWLINSWINH